MVFNLNALSVSISGKDTVIRTIALSVEGLISNHLSKENK